jgi:hypothetical protein
MTSLWGPLGWMTLHSTACAYSETPSNQEKQAMHMWLDAFRDTITCPTCKAHFTTTLANYRVQFPTVLQSRHDFVIFTFRAHNSVNRRLRKPVYNSVEECMTVLRNNVRMTSAKQYRDAYINHIARFWRTFQDISGIVALKKIQELKKIEAQYVSVHDTNFVVEIRADVVVLPQVVMDRDSGQQERAPVHLRQGPAGFRITSQGIRLLR